MSDKLVYRECGSCGVQCVAPCRICRPCQGELLEQADCRRLMAEIQAWHHKYGQVPAYRDMDNKSVARRRFGSWNQALAAAGFDPRAHGTRKEPMRLGRPDRIPVRRRDGTVRAWAIVDPEFHEELSRFHWHNTKGYAYRANKDGRPKQLPMHRHVLGDEQPDGFDCDHINGDRLDNRRSNLRVLTRGQNLQNRTAPTGGNSRFRGVHRATGARSWTARCSQNNRNVHIGSFTDELEAAIAAQLWRDEHMPFAQPDPAVVEVLGGWPPAEVVAA